MAAMAAADGNEDNGKNDSDEDNDSRTSSALISLGEFFSHTTAFSVL
jgi:hypothetical protein